MASDTAVETPKPAQAAGKKKATSKRGRKARKATGAKQAAAPRKRTMSTPADRAKILAAADKEGLTAQQVQKRFGVKPVTYYSWRKASKTKRGPGRPPGRPKKSGTDLLASFDLSGQLREAIKLEIARLLPEIIREELRG